MVRDIRIADFSYPLPDEQIARHPLPNRDACRLIHSDPCGRITHHSFSELPELLEPETLLVCNNTRVINARLQFRKPAGARIEIFLLEPADPADYALALGAEKRCSWRCMIGNLKRWKSGDLSLNVNIGGQEVILSASRVSVLEGGEHEVEFSWQPSSISFADILQAAGSIPIPPYLKRESEDSDTSDYQTVYSRIEGSVAAPTAGLHFTAPLIESLRKRGVRVSELTLHVGAGTFRPVKSELIADHPMHTETFEVTRALLDDLIAAVSEGSPVCAVGTTTVRTLESLPLISRHLSEDIPHVGQWEAYDDPLEGSSLDALLRIRDFMVACGIDALRASTAIMIAPGFRWNIVDRMITNFHQPESTLLLLVSSFIDPIPADNPGWREVYEEALRNKYRFLSYGDACLLDTRAIRIYVPTSKSMSARALMMSSLAASPIEIEGLTACDDTVALSEAINSIASSGEKEINVGAAGTALRFMTARISVQPDVEAILTGTPRLCQRPMSAGVDSMRALGADIAYLGAAGCAPLRIKGKRLCGGKVEVDASRSSQFASALMLVAPALSSPLEINFASKGAVSVPYLEMTAAMMRRCGVEVKATPSGYLIPAQSYSSPSPIRIEGDWSGASYFYEAVALLPSGIPVFLPGMVAPEQSVQGDAGCAALFEAMGVVTRAVNGGIVISRHHSGSATASFEADMGAMPDLVPALSVALALRGIPFRLCNVAHLVIKESDRIAALTAGLEILGFDCAYDPRANGGTWICSGVQQRPVADRVIDTADDHRIAMAFAMAAIRYPGKIRLADPLVVKKSFPDFWQQFQKLGINLSI